MEGNGRDSRTHHPDLAHLCPVQRGMVVVFLLSASDNVVIDTKAASHALADIGLFASV